MSTTSSSRPRPWLCLAALALLACAPGAAPAAWADAQAAQGGVGRSARPLHLRPARLRAARGRRLGAALARLAGPHFRAHARDPVVIDVRLVEALDRRPRDAAPVIVLNDQVLVNTYAGAEAPDQLLAFLPDRSLLRERNEVRVHWSGNAQASRSPEPLSFASADIDGD